MSDETEIKPKICGLCSVCFYDNWIVPDEDICKMLEVVLLKTNTCESKDVDMCNTCLEDLIKCYDFKTLCLQMVDCVNLFDRDHSDSILVNDVSGKTGKQKGKSEIRNDTVEDQTVCRLCMGLINGPSVCLNDIMEGSMPVKALLTKFFPQLDLDVTRDPKFCLACHQSLREYFTFVGKYSEEVQGAETCESREAKVNVNEFTVKTEVKGDDNVQVKKEVIEGEDVKTRVGYEGVDTKTGDEETTRVKEEFLVNKDDSNRQQTSLDRDSAESHTKETCSQTPPDWYPCEHCNYKARKVGYLRQHMVVHNNETRAKFHYCYHCLFKSAHRSSLRWHMIKLHADVLYKCEECDYTTRYQDSFDKHKLMHLQRLEEFKCDKCTYRTKRRYYLELHKKCHQNVRDGRVIGDNPNRLVPCPVCNFKTKYMKQHSLLHKTNSN